MYGFGSKKGLIEDFASSSLTEYSVVVINGYLPSVNLKQVLSLVILDVDYLAIKKMVLRITNHLWFTNSDSISNS